MSPVNQGWFEPCWRPIEGRDPGDEQPEPRFEHDSPAGIQTYPPSLTSSPTRIFDTGADRDTEDGKLDYEAFLSPIVLRRYAEYMHAHRTRADGTLRDGDNWQKGIPFDAYMKSGWRHFFDWWAMHRWDPENVEDTEFMEEAICALIFNAMGYLHELLAASAGSLPENGKC